MVKTLLIPRKEMRIERLISVVNQNRQSIRQGGQPRRLKKGGEKCVNFAIL